MYHAEVSTNFSLDGFVALAHHVHIINLLLLHLVPWLLCYIIFFVFVSLVLPYTSLRMYNEEQVNKTKRSPLISISKGRLALTPSLPRYMITCTHVLNEVQGMKPSPLTGYVFLGQSQPKHGPSPRRFHATSVMDGGGRAQTEKGCVEFDRPRERCAACRVWNHRKHVSDIRASAGGQVTPSDLTYFLHCGQHHRPEHTNFQAHSHTRQAACCVPRQHHFPPGCLKV